MATEEIEISQLELAEEILADMVTPVETATETKAITLSQLKKWLGLPLPTGLIFPAVGRIDNSRFTLLDGKTLSRNGTYAEFCAEVIEQVNAGNWFSCTQSEYDEDLSKYGQCGRFVVENEYVRIPTITRYIGATITLSEIGKTYAESLPNITWQIQGDDHVLATGNINIKNGYIGSYAAQSVSGESQTILDFSANEQSSAYQNGAKVNPEHTKYPYYMVVSTTGQTEEVVIDINNVYGDLNLKANKDLSNISNSAKEMIVGLGAPDYSSTIALGANSFPYTAPRAGVVFIRAQAQNSSLYIAVNGVKMVEQQAPTQYNGRSGKVVVDKNDVVTTSSTTFLEASFTKFKGV